MSLVSGTIGPIGRSARCLPGAVALALCAAVAPATATAQQAPSGAPPGDSAQRRIIAQLRSDLRMLVTAQEARFAERGAYASSLDELGAARYRASEGASVEIVGNTGRAYGAVARRAGWAGSCVMQVGTGDGNAPRTALEQKRFPEGEPACDGDGTTERAAFAREAQSRAVTALMRLSKHQERHFGRTGAYVTDPAALPGLRLPATITVTIELATAPNGEAVFLATATDSRYAGHSCVLASGWARFAGRATTLAEGRHAGGLGTAVCDTFK